MTYLLLAFWVMRDLWAGPSGRTLSGNRGDHTLFLFLLAHGERVVYHGAALLHSEQLNAPAGVNMMANTSVLALSVPLAPVTHRYGPGVTAALLLTLGLAGSALAWYWLLRRRMELGRPAAWIGGLWGGFAPGWLSHASGHINLVCGFVLPFVLDQVLRLRLPGRVWRGGVALGLLIILQVFISEETLLLMAIALVVFLIAYAVMDPRTVCACAGRFGAGGAVAALVAGASLSYPLHYQFYGPGHYRGQPFVLDRFATSLGSLVTLPRESLFGSDAVASRFSASATEDTVFWGPGAALMFLVAIVVLWRSVAARAAAVTALVLLIVSFGSHFRIDSRPGGRASPLAWTMRVPLLDLVTTPRYALVSTAIVGILLAWASDKAFRRRRWRANAHAPTGTDRVPASGLAKSVHVAGLMAARVLSPRVLFAAGLIAALAPLLPRPAPTQAEPPAPAFFTQAMWRPYLRGSDRSMVIVPLPNRDGGREAMRLAALSNSAFPMPGGYFMGPADPPRDMTGAWTSPPRYTSALLNTAVATGRAPTTLTLTDRAKILDDLRYWNAGLLVLLPDTPHWATLFRLLTQLLGPPVGVGGVTLWADLPR
ncbi:hypothetical protein [Actinoplanes awajinensis]|uniref:hypothetical protein n=1 Tax=Actinoplanes awajinensis TaxID=135946 RepID=UPI0012FCD196|nr:hypothetical protein [Actinoplanes awajinensis]